MIADTTEIGEMIADTVEIREVSNQGRHPCAECSVFYRSMPVTRAGVLCAHGPVSSHSTGSGKTPIASFNHPTSSIGQVTSRTQQDGHVPADLPYVHLSKGGQPPPRVLRRIPRVSRTQAVNKLAIILDGIVGKNDHHSWDGLFWFSSRWLRVHRRGVQKKLDHRSKLTPQRRIRPTSPLIHPYHTTLIQAQTQPPGNPSFPGVNQVGGGGLQGSCTLRLL